MQAEPQIETQIQDGRHDFDFLMGSWKISHRLLRQRLKGSTDWQTFTGYADARKILGGLGNIDEGRFEGSFGTLHAITVRLFNPTSQEWYIYWAAANRPTGEFDVPMIGKFENGVGTFYAQEIHDGKHVYSRFIWTVSSVDRCHWEQALSEDGGQTWETNWTMDFERIQDGQR